MTKLPKIRIVDQLRRDLARYALERAKAHVHFALEEYWTASDLAREADKIAIEEGHVYKFGKPLPAAINKPDVINMQDSPPQRIVAHCRYHLAHDTVTPGLCYMDAEDIHKDMMYLPEPDLSRYLIATARLDLLSAKERRDLAATKPHWNWSSFADDEEIEEIPAEHRWAFHAGDYVIAAERLWYVGRFDEARQHIATSLRGLEIRKERRETGIGRAERIREGGVLFSSWMNLKEGSVPASEKNLMGVLRSFEKYLAGFAAEKYLARVSGDCKSYRVMLRVYSNWFKLEYGIDWSGREEFLDCFPHYCRPYPPAFARLSPEKQREVETWYAEVLRLADEWDMHGANSR